AGELRNSKRCGLSVRYEIQLRLKKSANGRIPCGSSSKRWQLLQLAGKSPCGVAKRTSRNKRSPNCFCKLLTCLCCDQPDKLINSSPRKARRVPCLIVL